MHFIKIMVFPTISFISQHLSLINIKDYSDFHVHFVRLRREALTTVLKHFDHKNSALLCFINFINIH